MLTKTRKYISMKKLILSLFLLINLNLIATDTPPALVLSFFERLSTQGIRARVLHLSTSSINTDYGTCIITDDEIIVTIDGQTVHWATPGGPWDIEYYSQTGELKLVPRQSLEFEIPSFKPHSFESITRDFPTPESFIQSKLSDIHSRPIEVPIIQAPTIDTPSTERPLPERTLIKTSEQEAPQHAPIHQEKAIATLLADSNKLIFEKIILQIQNCSEEQVHQIMTSIKAQVKKQQIDEQIFFNQLKELVEKTIKWYTPPHRSSSFGLAVGTVAIGTISIGLFALVYHLYKKRSQPFIDKLNHLENEIKQRGGHTKNRGPFIDIDLDRSISETEYNQLNDLHKNFVSTTNQKRAQRESTLETGLGVAGLFTGLMATTTGIGSFNEWYYQYDKKRYQLLFLLNNEIEKLIKK